ncbi:MAG: hypothetical protein ACI8VC_002678 [Candidatus Endobugula sp.]|jgi:hypothetical protein
MKGGVTFLASQTHNAASTGLVKMAIFLRFLQKSDSFTKSECLALLGAANPMHYALRTNHAE